MKGNGKKSVSISISWFWGILELAFIVLKLKGIIDWSWFWVLAPIWVPIVLCGVTLVLIGIFSKSRW